MFDDRFGSFRGAVRLLLAYGQVALGRASILRAQDVRRIVFVCHGNICRSAFADVVAAKHGLRVTSFGLSTSADKPAHPPAAASALRLGHDLSAHRTTRVEDYVAEPGDLLLAMEVRQLRRLSRSARLKSVPRSLLGLWARPRFPHLHDPYELSDAYMLRCLERIAHAIPALVTSFPGARIS